MAKQVATTLRISEDLREVLKECAIENSRSLNQEIEARLLQSLQNATPVGLFAGRGFDFPESAALARRVGELADTLSRYYGVWNHSEPTRVELKAGFTHMIELSTSDDDPNREDNSEAPGSNGRMMAEMIGRRLNKELEQANKGELD